jgi:hypothetical protein
MTRRDLPGDSAKATAAEHARLAAKRAAEQAERQRRFEAMQARRSR